MDIFAYMSTKGRYDSTLPLALVSLTQQTLLPKEFVLFDDNIPQIDLRKNPLYQYIFGLLEFKGIKWSVVYGEGKGQVLNHNKAIDICKLPYLFRMDDDNILEPNVLEVLASHMTDKVGAAAPLVLHPNQHIHNLPSHFSHNKIEFCEDPSQLNIQWFTHPDGKVKSVDHLYSVFMYRSDVAKQVGGYCKELSPKGHREESIFSYSIKRAGYDLLVVPSARVYHFRYSGGIRS